LTRRVASKPSAAGSAPVPRAGKSKPNAATSNAAAARKAMLQANSGVERSRPEPVTSDTQAYPIGKGRKHLKGISIFMHPIAKETLDRISSEHGKTVQDLGLEALNLLFRHYGEKPVA